MQIKCSYVIDRVVGELDFGLSLRTYPLRVGWEAIRTFISVKIAVISLISVRNPMNEVRNTRKQVRLLLKFLFRDKWAIC